MKRLYPARGVAICISAAALLATPAWARHAPHHRHPMERASAQMVPIPRPEAADEQSGARQSDDGQVAALEPQDDANTGREPDWTAASQDADAPTIVQTGSHLYCVKFARELSGIDILGDARTWWDRAAGLYERSANPEAGAVLVFAATKRISRGHVAVVKRIVSAHEIVVDHANWMNDGNIYLNMPVKDVSAAGDWSEVRVWDARDNQWGARTYPVRGFVLARAALQS
jgi:surface antigen